MNTDMTQPLPDRVYSMENLVLMTKPLIAASQKAMIAVQTLKQEDVRSWFSLDNCIIGFSLS